MNEPSTNKHTPAIVLCDASGVVVHMNREASDLTGVEPGRRCWETVGELEGAVGLPCEVGCVQRLLARGEGHAHTSPVELPDGRYNLVCLSMGGEAVCVLSRLGKAPQAWQRVTPRERDVLRLLARGQTTQGIAEELGMSGATVRTHIEHMRRRFGVSTRAGLVGCCYEVGLI